MIEFEKEIAEAERRYICKPRWKRLTGYVPKRRDLLKISYRSFRHYAKKHNL